jgi:hypothetical protein
MKIGDEKGERPGSLDLIAFFSFSAILPRALTWLLSAFCFQTSFIL